MSEPEAKPEPEPAPPVGKSDGELLAEIRDLLVELLAALHGKRRD